jgi:hypothetical protein
VLDEIFSQREYEPPGPVAQVLGALGPITVADIGANIGLFGAFISTQQPLTWPILADPRFRRPRASAVVLEYHHEGCPGEEPETDAEAGLRAAGYQTAPGPTKPVYGAGILWGWREAA